MIRVSDHAMSHNKGIRHLSDYLPWAAIVAPGVILQKDGIFQSTYEVVGYDFLSASDDFIERIISSVNNLCMHLTSGWSVFVEARRSIHDICSNMKWDSDFDNEIGTLIEQERMNYYSEHSLFQMRFFLTFCFQKSELENRVSKFFNDNENSLEQILIEFQKKLQDITGLLGECFRKVQLLDNGALLTYFHSCVSSSEQSVIAPPSTMYIDAFVTDESLSIEETLRLGNHYLGVISVHDFPHATRADLMEDLQRLPLEFRWQTRMVFIDESQAIQDIKRYRKKHYSQRKGLLKVIQEQKSGEEGLENTEAIMRALDAEAALELAGKNTVRFGYFTSVLVVQDESIPVLSKKVDKVKEVFQKKGFIVKEEQLNAMDAWLSSLPGNVYNNVRRALIHSVNFAHILPLSTRWMGLSVNNHLGKICDNYSPHILANSDTNACYINLNNNSDVGHTFIVGPTGAGKSTILGMLCAQFLRYPNARVYIFDKDLSALPLTKKIGGRYFIPGAENDSISFQPFKEINSNENLQWAIQFCKQILHLHGIEVDGKRLDEIKQSCILLANLQQTQRTFSSLFEILQDATIKSVFSKYCSLDMLGTLFDGVEQTQIQDRWIMYEMGHLMKMGKDAVIPALIYLFHKIEQSFDGSPTLLVLDEGWLFLQHEAFAKQFQIWLKTLRKKNVFVIMATQELADVVRSTLLETIISACQTKIFLPDKSAQQVYMKEYYQNFGLQDKEISIIANAQAKKEYYLVSPLGSLLFSLDLGDSALDILSNKIPKEETKQTGVIVS